MLSLALNAPWTIKEVIFHSYRTARTHPIVLEVAYEHGDSVDKIRNQLAEQCDGKKDNHTVYEVVYREGERVYFWFSDWKLRIGLKLHKENW